MRSSFHLFNAFMCIIAAGIVEAFQPLSAARQQQRLHSIIRHNNHPLFSSSSYLSSLSSSTTSVSNETNNKIAPVSSVTVIDYNNNHEEDTSMQPQTATTTIHSSSPASVQSVPVQVTEQTVAPVVISPKKKFVHVPNKNKNPVTIANTVQELLCAMNGHSSSGDIGKNIDNNIDNSENNIKSSGMSLILYHASYCKICQRAGMQLIRASKEYPSVKFAKIEASVFPDPATPKLKSLGVTKFPFIQIYRYGKCVASFSTGPTHMFMRRVRDTLDLCLERDDECWNSFVTEFTNEIESNQLSRNNLLLPDEVVDEAAQPLP
jgi:thiol-disulfide isomerase/thioredoxin